MREVNGYVIVAAVSGTICYKVLYGKNVNLNNQHYENLSSNGLAPYISLKEMGLGAREILEKKIFSCIKSAHLKMQIAESKKELFELKNYKSLVTIMISDDYGPSNRILLGPIVKGKLNEGSLACARIVNNGFKTYKAFDDALYCLSEINRQAQCPATIATFHLKYLKI